MNGLRGGRRTASPVRLTLAGALGSDIDGAWWPHTGSVARELPELIGSLHAALGEVVDININWSSTAGAPVLNTMSTGAMTKMGWSDRRQRLMVVVGKTACARLIVIPHTTSATLARMVLRRAASMPIPLAEQETSEFQTADRVVRSAEVESAAWAAREADGPTTPENTRAGTA
ncbi:MAG TPA: DUF5994 family protein [Mycobacterium sp.]|nr:DUF5994 family protein [Mycobacterium sp.]